MTEKEQINYLNQMVENILQHKSVLNMDNSPEEAEITKLARLLTADDPTDQSQIKESVKEKIRMQTRQRKDTANKNQNGSPSPIHVLRLTKRWIPLAAIALAGALLVFVFSVPSVKAFAEGFIIRIGNLIISEGPTDAQTYVATVQSGVPTATLDPNFVCTDCVEPGIAGLLTVSQASLKAGYPVFEAQYIPEGYQITSRDVYISGQTITTDTSYRMELATPLHGGEQISAVIAIGQTSFVEGSKP